MPAKIGLAYPDVRGVTDRITLAARTAVLATLGLAGSVLLPAAAAQTATNPAPAASATPAEAPPPEAAPPDSAQDSGTLQEIVITATRHQEVMSKVPVSVSAFSQETLDLKGVKDFTDIAKYTPGVTIDAGGTNAIAIRGISSSGGSGTTGIYIDDTPIQIRALGFNPDDTLPKTFDLERVEVLRGPQGTLFGAGSEGGTVRYLMAEPNMNKASVYARNEVSYTQGGTASYEAGVAGGAPIIENVLGFRASIWYRHDGGWIDRIDPFTLATVQNDANYDNTVVMRVAAKWAVNDLWTITPSVIYQDRKRNDISVYWPTVTGANGTTVRSDPGSDKYISANPTARPEPDHYLLPALKVETEIGSASLISNTSFYNRSDLSGYDGTLYNMGYYQTLATRVYPPGSALYPGGATIPGSTPGFSSLFFQNPNLYPLIDQNGIHLPASVQNYRAPATVTNDQKVYTEEIRLQSNDPASAWTWTTGIFWQLQRQSSLEAIFDPNVDQLFNALFGTPATGPNAFGYPLVNGGYSYYNLNTGHDRQVALFGEATYALTSRIKLTAGARIAKTSFDFSHNASGTQQGAPLNLTGNQASNPFTPKLSASFQADPNDLYYATYSKGFRTGGDNAPVPANLCQGVFTALGLGSQSPSTYNSDTVNSYEVGAKNKIGNGLRLASSLYYISWDNIQQNIYLPGCGFQFTTNVGKAVAKGFDLQADWSPSDALSFESAIGYTSARFITDASLSPTALYPVVRAGDAITGESGSGAPPWTITLGAQYNFHAFDHQSFFRVDYEFESKNGWKTAALDPTVSPTIYNPFAYAPPQTTFVSIRSGMSFNHWNISGFIDNLLDAHPQLPPSSYATSDVDPNANPGQGALIRGYTFRPRTYGVTSVYRF